MDMIPPTPWCTVVIPVHNGEATLGRALASIARQGGPPPAVVVVDDHSDDGTVALAESLGATVLSAPERGAAAARNVGVQSAQTEFVAFLDADDAWLSDDYLESARECVDGGARFVRSARVDRREDVTESTVRTGPPSITPVSLLNSNPVTTSGVVVHRGEAIDAGLFPVGIHYCEDAVLWINLIARDVRTARSRGIVEYTVRSTRETWRSVYALETNRLLVISMFATQLDLSRTEVRDIVRSTRRLVGLRFLASGYGRSAARNLLLARSPIAALTVLPRPVMARLRRARWRVL